MVLLGYAALRELRDMLAAMDGAANLHLKPFGEIFFLTLGVFDLAKTLLEEEVTDKEMKIPSGPFASIRPDDSQ